MKPTIDQLALTLYQRRHDQGGDFNVKEVIDDLVIAVERGEVAGDPVEDRARKAVTAVDQRFRKHGDPIQDQLVFEGFEWPAVLTLGHGERHAARTALLQHVLADFGVKSKNHADLTARFAAHSAKLPLLLPLLQQGMTLAEAIQAAGDA